MNPLVTVNILSYNRKDELRNTLRKVYEQDYKNIEVIVVDNASCDGSSEMVKTEFRDVILIELDENIGIAGWNMGFEIAKGEYVLVLDDDSYPTEKAIEYGLEVFNKYTRVGIVAYQINEGNNFRKGKGRNNQQLSFVNNFVGCGALIQKQIINQIGGYLPELFIYFHEIEFSMRVINKGYRIIQINDSLVIHNNPIYKQEKVQDRKVYFDIRNHIYILLLRFPINMILFLVFRSMLGKIFWSIKSFRFALVLKAIINSINLFVKNKSRKEILNNNTQQIFLNGKFGGGFFFKNKNYGLNKFWK